MEQFIGTKIVKAEPMAKDGQPGYKVVYEDGYESWSPKDVFNNAYRRTDFMSFGLAIEALRMGKKVARKGWNGEGIFLVLVSIQEQRCYMTAPFICIDTTGLKTNNPHAPKCRVPWLASQTDMLADDWFIVD